MEDFIIQDGPNWQQYKVVPVHKQWAMCLLQFSRQHMNPSQQNNPEQPKPIFGGFSSFASSPLDNSSQQKKKQGKSILEGGFTSPSPGLTFGSKLFGSNKPQGTPSLFQNLSAPSDGKKPLFGTDQQNASSSFANIGQDAKNAFTIPNKSADTPSGGGLLGGLFNKPASTNEGNIFTIPKNPFSNQEPKKEDQKGKPKEAQPEIKSTPILGIFGNSSSPSPNLGLSATLPVADSNKPVTGSLFGKNSVGSLFSNNAPPNLSQPKKEESPQPNISLLPPKNELTPEFKQSKEPLAVPIIDNVEKTPLPSFNPTPKQGSDKPSLFGKPLEGSNKVGSLFSLKANEDKPKESSDKFSLFNNKSDVVNHSVKSGSLFPQWKSAAAAPQQNEKVAKKNQSAPIDLSKSTPNVSLLFGSNLQNKTPNNDEANKNEKSVISGEAEIKTNENQKTTPTQPQPEISVSPPVPEIPAKTVQEPEKPVDISSKPSRSPQKAFSFRLTEQSNINEPQPQSQARSRLPTFDAKQNEQIFSQNKPSATLIQPKNSEDFFRLRKLCQFLSQESEAQVMQNCAKIEKSFRKYFSISKSQDRSLVYQPFSFLPGLKPTEGANKVLNDFSIVLARIFHIPEVNYEAFGELFTCMLKELSYYDKFFDGNKLKDSYFLNSKMYNVLSQDNIELVWDGDEAAAIICQFIKYYTSFSMKCLKRVEMLPKCFRKTSLYDLLLQTSVLLNFRYPITENAMIVDAMKANDIRMMNQINKIILGLLKTQFNMQNNQDIISKTCILNIIQLVNELPICPTVKVFQRVILKQLNLDRSSRDQNKELIAKLDHTTSVSLMPFRAILYRLDKSKKKNNPNIKDLFSQIDGPEWIDWLSVYLGEDNIRLNQKEVEYLIKSLKAMQIKNIDKIVNKESQINRLISIMLQESQVKNFYESISALVFSQESIKKVEQQYFKNNLLYNDLRDLANQIRKFPNCEFNEEDMPQLFGKSLYLLTVLAIQPERALQFQNALFDIDGFIDVTSFRCDRVCNLVIDILAYFSAKNLNEEIVIKSFEAIISLFQCHSTKPYMSLAMAINRPQIEFLHKNISHKLIRTLQQFLTHMISAKQFYASTRVASQNDKVEKVYPFRYQISKYLSLTENLPVAIPLYWFSNCLKISTKQIYSPDLLEMMLSKVKIYANSSKTIETPFILSAIVQASNQANFWKELSSKLEASVRFISDRYSIQNKYLYEQSDLSAASVVFSSLNLLKTMLELRQIKNKAQKEHPRHFICHLLSSLNCLSELDREYIQSGSEPELISKKTVPPIVSLLSLLGEPSAFSNTSTDIKIEWLYEEDRKINLEDLRKINQESEDIDYAILKDPLLHPFNEYLDCYENIASLACYVLKEMLPEIREISLEGLFYMCIPNVNNTSIEHYMKLRDQTIKTFIQCLTSPSLSLRRNSWALLCCLRNTSQNKKLTKDIFNKYSEVRNHITLHPYLDYMLQFVLAEAKDHTYNSSEILVEIMIKLEGKELSHIVEDIEAYKDEGEHVLSLHLFIRYLQQKKILQKCQYFRICSLLSEIILREIYDNHQHGARHSAQLLKIYCETELIDAFNKNRRPTQLELPLQICNPHVPRLYGKDILEMYITCPEYKSDDLIAVQVNNVVNWFSARIDDTIDHVNSFLLVTLSIDELYYANHPIKLLSPKRSQIFCQRHLEPRKYKAYELFGHSQRDSASQVRFILNFLLKKMEVIRKHNLGSDILKLYCIFDLCLGWLKNCKTYKKTDLIVECNNILSTCFNELEEPLTQQISVKLLLTCVNILSSQTHEETASRIKQVIMKTLGSVYSIAPDLKQQLLSLFTIIPPNKDELHILELLTRMWFCEENNQYFYNQSRVIYKLCELHPFEMAQLKVLSKCDRILKFEDSTLQGARYRQGLRTNEAKNWLWILKIATVLMENGMKSTLVVHQISKFVEHNKKRVFFTFNQCRQDLNLKKKQKQLCIKVNLAQLDELEATLSFFVVLAQCKMWIEMNRQLFEELLYYLMHRTIVLFAPSSVGQKLRKKYIPQSRNEKVMWELQAGEDLLKQQMGSISEGYDPDRLEDEYATQLLDYNALRPCVFILAMSLRYNQCLKLWLLGCSYGMRSSCFVREYFSRPIITDLRGNPLKYSLTHWEHLNKAISEIVQSLTNRVREWGKWHAKNELVDMLNDCFNSAQFFTQAGYAYTLIDLPRNEEELIKELGQSVCFALEMGACHLVSQVYFKNKTGAFWKENLQSFQEKLLKQSLLAEEKLIQNKVNRDDSIFEHLKYSKELLTQVKYS